MHLHYQYNYSNPTFNNRALDVCRVPLPKLNSDNYSTQKTTTSSSKIIAKSKVKKIIILITQLKEKKKLEELYQEL